MEYISPFRKRREVRRRPFRAVTAQSGGHAGRVRESLWNGGPGVRIAMRLLRASTLMELESELETLIHEVASTARRRKRRERKKVPREQTIRERVGALVERVKPPLQKGIGFAAGAAATWGIERLLDYLTRTIGQEVGDIGHGATSMQQANDLANLLSRAAHEMVFLPDRIPPAVAAEIGVRRGARAVLRGKRPMKGGLPWGRRPVSRSIYAGHPIGVFSNTEQIGLEPQLSDGLWRRGGNSIVVVNCRPCHRQRDGAFH